MGTVWSLLWVDPGRPDPRPLVEAALASVVQQMSAWEEGSDLCRFNRAPAGSWHALPGAFAMVLRAALAVAAATDGAFDPTLGRLVDLWGFGPNPPPWPAPPPAAALAAARGAAGWQRLRQDTEGRFLQPGGLAIDLNGIAKGHAVDRVAARLLDAGLTGFLLEIGGELRGEGVRPDGTPWWVALEGPPEAGAATELLVALHGLSVATSGDYRRGFSHGGRRYAHTLDPAEGVPLGASVAAVSVLAGDCLHADAWATALTVLGPEAGPAYAARHGLAARFLLRGPSGLAEVMSPALAAMLD
ncbi:FAD:protein FMN transferase [Roseomonas sp. BU-1]|uniref:FAD:protein FMN transferase n=2 Tax=Falsiroseomonas selenitidurans TaxID=2716335 RepID=A0ABX1E3G8_9PROT|nr:FAD:protein FMN transferase [Falsiroseomonas selenitidurans]